MKKQLVLLRKDLPEHNLKTGHMGLVDSLDQSKTDVLFFQISDFRNKKAETTKLSNIDTDKLMRIEDCSTHKKYHCKHYDTTDSYYDCRVRQGPFIHFNKSYDYCPIPEGLEVKLYYRNGDTDIRDYYGTIRYTLIGDQDDIIGWEVIGTADNYEY